MAHVHAHHHHAHDHDGHDHAGHDHAHHHGHHHLAAVGHRLGWAFVLTGVILAAEVVGAWFSGSLALLADAGHVLTDLAALGLAWFATRLSSRPASAEHTFGFHRSGILAALANAVTLIVIAIFITVEAVSRLRHPEPVTPLTMIPPALFGLVVNLGLGYWLSRDGGDNVNVRAAMLHVMGDALASVGVVIAGLVIWWTGWLAADPLLSVGIAGLIAVGAWQIVSETLTVLMEGVPKHIDTHRVVAQLVEIEGVREIHDLHIWTIGSGLTALSCHVLIDDQHLSQGATIIQEMTHLVEHEYGIDHVTIQPECESCDMNSVFCQIATPRAASADS